MLETFKQADFADGRGGDTIVFLLESDFLEGDDLTSVQVSALVYDTVGALSEFLLALIAFQLGGLLDEALGLGRLLGLHLSIHCLSGACCLHDSLLFAVFFL